MLTDEEIRNSKFKCSVDYCMRHPTRGDLIIRINAKGEPFVGLCEEHLDAYEGDLS